VPDDPASQFDRRGADCRGDRGDRRRDPPRREGQSSPLEPTWTRRATRSVPKASPSLSAAKQPGS
jgi:hypothetical protein